MLVKVKYKTGKIKMVKQKDAELLEKIKMATIVRDGADGDEKPRKQKAIQVPSREQETRDNQATSLVAFALSQNMIESEEEFALLSDEGRAELLREFENMQKKENQPRANDSRREYQTRDMVAKNSDNKNQKQQTKEKKKG